MAAKLIFTCALHVCVATALAHRHSQYSSRAAPYVPPPELVTNLHFFFHDTIGGKNPTAVAVAHANLTDKSVAPFGTVFAVDDPLTVGPELTSEVIGNARGIYVETCHHKVLSPILYLDFGFTSGEFNGSSISVFSRNPVLEKEREVAVVGGRGKFRMARGFAQLTTYSVNETAAIVEYNVTVVYY